MDALKVALANLRDATKLIDAGDRVILLDEIERLRKGAERYRWLAERFTGFDFDWMPSNDDSGDGKVVLCFEMSRSMRISADVTASIDAAMTQGGGL